MLLTRPTAILAIALIFNAASDINAQKKIFQGQGLTVEVGKSNKDREGGSETYFWAGDGGLYTRQHIKDDVLYRKYGSDLELVDEIVSNIDYEIPGPMVSRDRLEFNGRILGIGTHTDVDAKVNHVYMIEFDKEKLKWKDAKRELGVVTENYFRNDGNLLIGVDVCSDESKFLVYHKLPENGDYLRFRFMVFDKELNILWQADHEFKYKSNVFFPCDDAWTGASGPMMRLDSGVSGAFKLTNGGKVVTWGNPKKDDENILTVVIDESDVQMRSFTYDNADIFNLKFIDATEGPGLWFMGRYEKKKELGEFICNVDEMSGAVGDPAIIDPPQQVIGEFDLMPQKKIDKEISKGKRIEINWAMPIFKKQLDDGRLLLVLEKNYYRTKTDQYGNTTTIYYSDGVMFLVFSPDLDLQWSYAFKKQQRGGARMNQSCMIIVRDERIYCLFNDNFKNLRPDWDGQKVHAFGAPNNPVTLVTLEIGSEGFSTREQAWETDDSYEIPMDPWSHFPNEINDNEYLFWMRKGAFRVPMKLTFD